MKLLLVKNLNLLCDIIIKIIAGKILMLTSLRMIVCKLEYGCEF